MKINEILKEGFWSGLGNLAHGAVLGATGAMKNAPDRLGAGTKLAADPNKIKALPKTFTPKSKADPDTDEAGANQAQTPSNNVGDQPVPKGKRLYVVAKLNKQMYFKTADGRWWEVPNQNFPDQGMVVASANADNLDRLTKDTVEYAKFVDIAVAKKAGKGKGKKPR